MGVYRLQTALDGAIELRMDATIKSVLEQDQSWPTQLGFIGESNENIKLAPSASEAEKKRVSEMIKAGSDKFFEVFYCNTD